MIAASKTAFSHWRRLQNRSDGDITAEYLFWRTEICRKSCCWQHGGDLWSHLREQKRRQNWCLLAMGVKKSILFIMKTLCGCNVLVIGRYMCLMVLESMCTGWPLGAVSAKTSHLQGRWINWRGPFGKMWQHIRKKTRISCKLQFIQSSFLWQIKLTFISNPSHSQFPLLCAKSSTNWKNAKVPAMSAS